MVARRHRMDGHQHENMDQPIPMSSADLDDSDVEAVVEVLRSGRLAIGPKSEEFERLLAGYLGVGHVVAVSSGTAALHLIVKALGIGPGQEVLLPSFSFAASANAVLYEGAVPVFVDIEPETYNIDPTDLERKITSRSTAIMAVDIFGHPAEWHEILSIAEKHGLKVIDDSCEALGAEYKGAKLGGFGDAATFAFYPNKQMTTGEGGVVATDNQDIARLCLSMRNQGREYKGGWLAHERLGFNYRMDEMSAALGVSQLRRLETFVAKRERVAGLYAERLRNVDGIRLPAVRPDVRVSWFAYVVTLREGLDRDRIITALDSEGIPVREYFPPLHLQPYLRGRFGVNSEDLPVTESVARRTIALPFHNNMTVEQVERVVNALVLAVG